MRLLHISDLHACEEGRLDQSRVLAAFVKDVEGLHAATQFDAVVFSGDLARTGSPTELELGQRLLLDLLEQKLGLSRERIFLVPGNHDVHRGAIDKWGEAGYVERLTTTEDANELLDKTPSLNRAIERLGHWFNFEEKYYEGIERVPAPSLGWSKVVEIDGKRIGFACLNSSWRAQGGEEDLRRLVVGDRQLAENLGDLEGSVDLRIAVMHHPTRWLAPWDENDARNQFERHPTIVLTGHLHEADPSLEMTKRGAAVYGRCGCLYESPRYENSYSAVDIDLAGQQVTFNIRSWYPDRGEFDEATAVAPDGRLTFPLPAHSTSSLVVGRPYNDVMSVITDEVYDKSVIADYVMTRQVSSVHDILVAPRFFGLPYQDAIAAIEVAETAKPSPTDPLMGLQSGKVVIVNGDEDAGVSNALLWLEASAFEADLSHSPVFVKFEPKFKASRFEKLLREKAGIVAKMSEGASLPPLLIAIDDVAPHSQGYCTALAKFIATHPEHRYLLGTHGDRHADLGRALQRAGVVFEKAFLGPFGSRQLRDLIFKLTGSEERTILAKTREIIGVAHLPRTPFIMATLVVVLAEQQQLTALNQSGLLDTYVNVLLSAEPAGALDEQAMDPRRREYFLAWLASILTRQGVAQLPRVEVEKAFMQRFQEFGWGAASSPGSVIQNLIERRILSIDSSGIGFRLPGLRSFFAAKHMLVDADFAEYVLTESLQHHEIIRHAAGLDRTSRALLARVGEITASYVEGVGGDVSTEMFELISNRPGWSRERGVENLRGRLETMSRLNERDTENSYDEQVDEFWDSIEPNDEPTFDASELDQFAQLFVGTVLLSSVLRSSELVDDLALKESLLREAIHAWGLIAVVWAVREDVSRTLVETLMEGLPSIREDEELSDRIRRVAELITVVMLGIVMRAELGTVHMEAIIRNVLDDDDFMSDSAHAVLATILYVELRLPDWAKRLTRLYELHGGHPLIAEVVRVQALLAYRFEPKLGPADQREIEALCTTLYARESPQVRGRDAPLARRDVKSEVVRMLRKSRLELRKPTEELAPLDPLDEELGPSQLEASTETGVG